ncbi:TonB family protein [Mucilaginibacter terrae]|uniref:TonB family protein n=1 Tax=Mucilaginibacter terrae TaxID=1955052 RepID=A0ABU3GUW5_9SPHI|nr:TonB family protein [Mucilaginibacter terrae]MDT3403576.1 TonB family protein [Mucilaginibacter terrae]
MSDNKPDILLIQKYLNGELNARAMHELERRALDDRFLAEALEGYAVNGKNQQDNIDELQKRLQQRVQPKTRRITLWPAISIAASVLVFIGFGGWWLLNYRPASNKPDLPVADKTEVAKNKSVPAVVPQQFKQEPQPVIKPTAPSQRYIAPQANSIMSETPVPNAPVAEGIKENAKYLRPTIGDSLKKVKSLDEVVVVGYGVQRKSVLTGSVATITADSIKPKPMEQALVGRAAGVQVANGAPGADNQIRIRGISSLYAKGDSVKIITGQILSADDKQPLPGVTVRVNSSGLAVGTDARGRFKIAATKKDELNIGYIGFESQKVNINGKDSLKVLLKENHSALSEVVVTSNSTHEPQEIINEAHPQNGWLKFNQYLNEEARVSTGKTGVVRVSFVVGTDGTLSDFKILKSLSPESDKEAVEIIKDGADWVPNVNHQPETVKLRIRFRKEK